MKVKRYDYPGQFCDLPLLLDDIEKMLRDGRYVLSREVATFEESFANFLGAEHVCGVNSGTDALILALNALDIGNGDEVISQANTFNATVTAICKVGATPVLVDADEESFLMATEQVESEITSRTKAIIPVHLFGKPTPMYRLLEIAGSRDLTMVEDAAQAHGARLGQRRVGTIGRLGCFSFHPSKNLAAAGDAGAICTNDEALRDRIRVLRGLGQDGQNHHVDIGWNSKLDAIQARVLSAKLPLLDQWNQSRREIAQAYRERLSDLELTFQSECKDGDEHVYHQFQIRTPHRDALLTHLRDSGVDAVVRYPTPIHQQPAFDSYGWRTGQFPVAERLAKELLCLPIRPGMPDHEVQCVIESVRAFFREQR